MRVYIGETFPQYTQLTVTLVGVRNPDYSGTLTYTLAIMDSGVAAEDNLVSRVNSYLTYTYSFKSNPTALVDLFQLTTEYLRQRAIRGFDDYEFYFRIFNDPTGAVTWRPRSKFMINMPSDYIVSPTV